MSNYFLSIITPIFNSELFLECMVNSVISQMTDEVELILVNDGSSDNTDAICRSFSEYKNIVYICSENHGAGFARNIGLNVAKGDWILFLDSDDLLMSRTINEDFMKMCVYAKNKNIDIIYSSISKTSMDLSEDVITRRAENYEDIKNYMPQLEFVSCLYRREFLNEKNIRFFQYQRQDVESAFRFLTFSNARSIICLPQLHYYLQRNNMGSNVNTWNINVVAEIKGRIYYELFMEWERKNKNVAEYLYNEFVKQYKLFLKSSFAVSNRITLSQLIMFKTMYENSCKVLRINRVKEYRLQLYSSVRIYLHFLWQLIKIVRNRKRKNDYENKAIIESKKYIEYNVIKNDLDRISNNLDNDWNSIHAQLVEY